MAITVTFTGPTDEVLADMRAFIGGRPITAAAEPQTVIVSVPAEKPARGKKATTETPAPAPVVEVSIEAADAKTDITVERIRAAAQTQAEAGKRDGIKELLTSFSVANLTALKPEQYSDFLTKLEAL